MANRWGKCGNCQISFFLGSKINTDRACSHKISRCLFLGRIAMSNLDNVLKSWDITLLTKVQKKSKLWFSGSHVWMWDLDHKQGWSLKNWCFWTVVLEQILESSLDCKEIKPVYFLRKSALNTHWKVWCWSWSSNSLATWCEELTHWKRPWCWERLKVGGEGDDRGWDGWMHHRLNGHEFEQASGVFDGQRSLACCSPWGHKQSDMTWELNNNNRI